MPKPVADLIQSTTADLRAGRESWRVLSLFCSLAAILAIVVQHIH